MHTLVSATKKEQEEMGKTPDRQSGSTGEVPIDFERTRLQHLQQSLDVLTIERLERLGLQQGWRCLEVGAGAGSIASWLARQVGQEGSVVATDIDTRLLDNTQEPNLEIRRQNILVDDLEQGSYDLVHTRAVLMHLADPLQAMQKMAAALRPDGWLLVEEFDWISFGAVDTANPASHPFNQTWETITRTLQALHIMDLYLGRHLRRLLEELGFTAIGNEGITGISRGGDPSTQFQLMNLQLAGPPLVGAGVLTEKEVAFLHHLLTDPSFYYIDATNFGVWGKRL
jgi:2-polyprenyl-3-methyl-5-hydroxy-6-metoxy-1,4-benzoquinol methylase